MKTVSFNAKICRDLNLALKREWEEKNDIGVSASSSILGFNTSPKQGLFVIPEKNSKASTVLLSTLDETLFIGDKAFPISTRLHEHIVHPRGYEYLESFYHLPFPTWIFKVEGLTLVKIVLVVHGENTVLIRYQLLSSYGDFVRLSVRPITGFRSSSERTHHDSKLIPKAKFSKGVISLTSPNAHPDLFLFHNAAVTDSSSMWFKGVTYANHYPPKEYEAEDLYSPCSLLYPFLKQDGNYLCASISPKLKVDPLLLDITEKNRRLDK